MRTLKTSGFLKILILLLFIPFGQSLLATEMPANMPALIEKLKKDPRGPYKGIFWFCPDGSIIPAKERCSKPGGIQHALHKDEVTALATNYHLYLGQILAGSNRSAFLDERNNYSRINQYQLGKYLERSDDGWIMRKARFYRGALQAEDEEAWGRDFLKWVLDNDSLVSRRFYHLRQFLRDVPHQGSNNLLDRIRANAKTIGDSLSSFMDIRVKIHNLPDAGDVDRVKSFRRTLRNKDKITPATQKMLEMLEKDLVEFYGATDAITLGKYLTYLPDKSAVKKSLNNLLNLLATNPSGREVCIHLSDLLFQIRTDFLQKALKGQRLLLMSLSQAAEAKLFRMLPEWKTNSRAELIEKGYHLARAATATGLIEFWEWELLQPQIIYPEANKTLSFAEFSLIVEGFRRAVEWGIGMVRSTYEEEIHRYSRFEPLAHGFIDDRIRSCPLLALGEVAGQLAAIRGTIAGSKNRILNLNDTGGARGLNPGVCSGELVVIEGAAENIDYDASKIYLLQTPPADLKPVAGILTISEGNAVSHVQLLARNLGIPNAVVTPQIFNALKQINGQRIFYAVSPRGTLILKAANEMATAEKQLVVKQEQTRTTITIDTRRINLKSNQVLSLYELRSTDSGRLCGPKAAKLGHLSALFPGRVPPGVVVSFGIYYEHLQQEMPGKGISYWQFLQDIFIRAENDRAGQKNPADIEKNTLARLRDLQEAIRQINILPAFKANLESRFTHIMGTEFGNLRLFIRSDTNMEDLKSFTGAGLNLTVPNIREPQKIYQAIRDVWASPFSERSYRWRQKYLTNPENVYPSILLLTSIDSDKSGVMITTGIESDNRNDVTIAFNLGIAGAVEGQASESYLLRSGGHNTLLAPSRSPHYQVLLPAGGVATHRADFSRPILSNGELHSLRKMAVEIEKILPGAPGMDTAGPYDVELAFWNDNLWLLQVRPFVENKAARSLEYLRSIDPPVNQRQAVPLSVSVGGTP